MPLDLQIKQSQEREWRFREERRKEIPNRLLDKTFGNEVVFEAQPLEYKEVPTIAQKLGIENLLQDPITFLKVQGIDQFIQEKIVEEGLHHGHAGYMTVLDRMLAKLPSPYEWLMRSGNKLFVLDVLTKEAALGSKLSVESFLKKVEEDTKNRRINSLLNQLKFELNKI